MAFREVRCVSRAQCTVRAAGRKILSRHGFWFSDVARTTAAVPSTQSTQVGAGLLSGISVATSRDNDKSKGTDDEERSDEEGKIKGLLVLEVKWLIPQVLSV